MLNDLINDIIEHEKSSSKSKKGVGVGNYGFFHLAKFSLDLLDTVADLVELTNMTVDDSDKSAGYVIVSGNSPLFYGKDGSRYKIWIKGILLKDPAKMSVDKVELVP